MSSCLQITPTSMAQIILIQRASVLQTPISWKCNVLDQCFLPGNPFHTTKLSADHRNKWMSAYLLTFPNHAKSEYHTTLRQWRFSQLLVGLTSCASNFFFSGTAKDKKFKIWEKWQKNEEHCACELFSLGWAADWVRLDAEKCVYSLCF